ncbi:bifunctional 4-hydroxy-2-oxoglutarate aldolase/2-dehydro-3-deoxy-phosphogluconate aldolase [Chroococcus sp. FPU101]|uniref:bifunctional 4-hydroxy-2-oxoglutarate aldolase/2-dehydro-3-deoxy-phosphogluconate aldolase n=1 Tax=Chroococcus sp. FPU101 TaxID=1974212 RepID=UPI001A8EE41A|nr:bifunctional 4-hydroxy-2-oxoglutarate aldolase/2-dehydro-3-deoxy-phosphogluconate aldolase [Chroococcus sp. FPU101]GFE70309.1 2-dehydro-3-deoxyphosphogluconate aldolase/4-hydroxy-2-oxoglutarate aldolase [Chroococcus sp. FPU101]
MTKNTDYLENWWQVLRQERVIAVIRAQNIDLAISLAKAVAQGGIKLIEITWNSTEPAQIIQQLNVELPDCWIGTGTILTVEELKEAILSGIRFCFTPNVNPTLIQIANQAEIPIIPGALTPTEIITAWQMGASCVKVFPIQAVGGASYIKALQGPMGQIPLIPTGGVTLDNAKEFISAGAIAVGLSGQLFPNAIIQSQAWSEITHLAEKLKQDLAQYTDSFG